MGTTDAHSANDNGNGVTEPLAVHLRCVAETAARFAERFGAAEQAGLAGLLHDLGKYADQFQRRLCDPREPGRDHWSAGAIVALAHHRTLGLLPALAVEGHHAGLMQLESPRFADVLPRRFLDEQACPPDVQTFTEPNLRLLLQRFHADGFRLPTVQGGLVPDGHHPAADMLDVRMLFSALVDADFVETEAHFSGDRETPRRPRAPGPPLEPDRALAVVRAHIRSLAAESAAAKSILGARQELFDACLAAGEAHPPGVFTLTAPTGSGKTLAMLAFALAHAARHGLRRVIVVLPFLNIIDQTAALYRKLFCAENGFDTGCVIEDHSNVHSPAAEGVGADDATCEAARLERLLAENWDAPFVLTTSVQCLESLMANRPGACRKLHRLAESVILFDEVQTLPPHLVVPTLATLSRLTQRFRASVVFSTATQPAFEHLHERVGTLAPTGWQPIEIVPRPDELFRQFSGRVRVRWRHESPMPWEKLADEIVARDQVLCIVNLTRHAQHLARTLQVRGGEGLLHLSTRLCPAHRVRVLAEVVRRLKAGEPVRLVATQCVEAGVDLSFPTVFRALGPLEAIAQAAGRCNRHGKLPGGGDVHVFAPESDAKYMYPPGAYAQAAQTTQAFLALRSANAGGAAPDARLDHPAVFRSYYRTFYDLTDAVAMQEDLQAALTACDFVEVARHYRLIAQDTINVLVPYEQGGFDALVSELDASGPRTPGWIRDWIRRARPCAVGLFRLPRDAPLWNHLAPLRFRHRDERPDQQCDWFVALAGLRYDALVGVDLDHDDGLIV